MTYKSDPVLPRDGVTGLVARSGGSGWYRVVGWYGVQPLVVMDGERTVFVTNEVVEVTYDPGLWEAAR